MSATRRPDGHGEGVGSVPAIEADAAGGPALAALREGLRDLGEAAVAVSGGVDSMTLAVVAGRTLGPNARMYHAVSPAVPPDATARVRAYAAREGWPLEVMDAGEFGDRPLPDEPREPLLLLQDQPLRRDGRPRGRNPGLGHQRG